VLTLLLIFTFIFINSKPADESTIDSRNIQDEVIRPVKIIVGATSRQKEHEVPEQTNEGKAEDKISSKGEGIRIEGVFNTPSTVIPWLLKKGGRLIVFNKDYRPLFELDGNGERVEITQPFIDGEWRNADYETRIFAKIPGVLKEKRAAILWPSHVWEKIYSSLERQEIINAKLIYEIRENALVVESVELKSQYDNNHLVPITLTIF